MKQRLVAALNDLVALLNQEAAAFGGTLANDPGARELRRDLGELTSRVVMPGAAEGEPSTLADLGLSITRDGTFQLDSARLNATLADSPDAAAAMFTTGASGVFATMDKLARENTLRRLPGSLGGSLERYEDQIERNDERLAKIAEQQESMRERLTRDLVAAERRIAASQSTLSFLQQQMTAAVKRTRARTPNMTVMARMIIGLRPLWMGLPRPKVNVLETGEKRENEQ